MNALIPTKPGIKTSEFWFVALFTLLANAGPFAESLPAPWGGVASALLGAVYVISRTKAKSLGVVLPLLLCGLLALALPACSYADAVVDTRGAVATAPDTDLDGIPDEITVPSNQVKPVLNDKGLDKINGELADILINATK